MTEGARKRVLVIGIYLLQKTHYAEAISEDLSTAKEWDIDLRWAALGDGSPLPTLAPLTKLHTRGPAAKFPLLNELLSDVDLAKYQFVLVTDDDVEIGAGFLDTFLRLQEKYDFSLAQPARTHDSYIDHYFVAQLLGIEARHTRFVEIGPVFSIRRDAFPMLLPFDAEAPMGWGLDFAWPAQLESAGLRLGIIDATPVRHALRKPVSGYDYASTEEAMRRYLHEHSHLSTDEAFLALETYPARGCGMRD